MTGNIFDRWGLPQHPSDRDVVTAYRRRVQKMHPDRVGQTAKAQEDFCRLQDEFQQIRTEQARDLYRAQNAPPISEPVSPPPLDPDPVAPLPPQAFVPSSDINIVLDVPLKKIWSGGYQRLWYNFAMPCGCGRSGACSLCKGTGQVFFRRAMDARWPPGVPPSSLLTWEGLGHHGSHAVGALSLRLRWTKTHGWDYQEGRPPSLWKTIKVPRQWRERGAYFYTRAPWGDLEKLYLPPGDPNFWEPVRLHQAFGPPWDVWVMVRPSWWGWIAVQGWWALLYPCERLLKKTLRVLKIAPHRD